MTPEDYCYHLAASPGSDFGYSLLGLPLAQRQALTAVTAFCAETTQLVDECRDSGVARTKLDWWRAELDRLFAGQPQHPVTRALQPRLTAFNLPEEYFREILDGVAMDLRQHRYETWADLRHYCYLVASTVGLLSMPIIGLAPGATFAQASAYAITLGIALQLTNILRDVGEDATRGRVYLPLEDLRRFDLTPEDIVHGVHDDRFIALMRFEIERAQTLFEEALPGIALLAPAARPAVGAAALFYRAILERIEANHYQVHTQRAHTTGLQKLMLLPGILWKVWRIPTPVLHTDLEVSRR